MYKQLYEKKYKECLLITPETFSESKQIAREGGNIAGDARENIEKRVGGTIISSLNAKDKPALDTGTNTPEIQ